MMKTRRGSGPRSSDPPDEGRRAEGREGFVFTTKNGRPIGTFRKRWHSAVRSNGPASRAASR